MNVLEKILEEIKDLKEKQNSSNQDYATGYLSALSTVEGIISGVKENDGWIPVDEELPPFGKRLQATILHHEWIADYDSSWVPEEEKTYYPKYTEVCEIYSMGCMWFYACKEDGYERNIAYIKPAKDLGNPISEIVAWQPLPKPYKPTEPKQTKNTQQELEDFWRDK